MLALKALGIVYNSTVFSQICTKVMNTKPTVVAPLPQCCRKWQRAVICVLLAFLVPLVIASLVLAAYAAIVPNNKAPILGPHSANGTYANATMF